MNTAPAQVSNALEFEGVIDTVTHANPEKGWGILKLKVDLKKYGHLPAVSRRGIVTLVGTIAHIGIGEKVKVSGNLTHHKTYGPQLEVSQITIAQPKTESEIANYLAKQVSFIGPKFSMMIVKKFGADTISIIDNTPDRLLEIPGIGEERVAKIKETWAIQKAYRELLLFTTNIGLSAKEFDRIYKIHKEKTVEKIKEDPYRLARDIWGIGFAKADAVARHLGIHELSELRIRAAMEHRLIEAQTEGHCFLYAQELIAHAIEFLEHPDINQSVVSTCLQRAVHIGFFKCEKGNCIYTPDLSQAEDNVVERLGLLMHTRMPDTLTDETTRKGILEAAANASTVQLDQTQIEAIYRTLTSKVSVVTGGPGTGKGLALDTKIPTPTGWTTMGKLQVGDEVFDDCGKPCIVTFVSEVHHRDCFQVAFDDGTCIVTDDQHQWMTWTRAARKSLGRRRKNKLNKRGTDQSHKRIHASIVTTPQIATSLLGIDGRLNHSIPLAGPLQMTSAILPIDPYVLGVWLGNGDTDGASITNGCGWIRSQVERHGYVTSDRVSRETAFRFGIFDRDGESLLPKLREINVLGNKHIPNKYLFACESDRMALLNGLMDTDGHCGERGRSEITFVTPVLAEHTRMLIESLGIKTHWDVRPAKINGVVKGTAYRSSFTTSKPVFRMPRKLSKLPSKVRPTTLVRYITAVDPVPSVSTRCIQVDSPSHLFLAGHGCIPTHNTTITKAIVAGYERAGMTITLFAPTGRAAKRMTQVIGRPAGTIHRTLFSIEKLAKTPEYRRNSDALRITGVVIVDEFSMVDVKLFAWLLKWIDPTAILVIVGDKDQLPSVSAGAVLRDLLAASVIPSTQLTQIFRQAAGSNIIVNAHKINSGVMPMWEYCGKNHAWPPKGDMWVMMIEEGPTQTEAALWCVANITKGMNLDPVRDCMVLAPMKNGDVGVLALNSRLQSLVNPNPAIWVDRGGGVRWGTGDKMMQMKNDYTLGVLNGDIGIVTDIAKDGDRLKSIQVDFDGERVTYDEAGQWNALQLAYASTIHKVQGSESPIVVICLHNSHYMMLQRNLLYTGVTRGKQLVVLIASGSALARAIGNNVVERRNTLLTEKLTTRLSH